LGVACLRQGRFEEARACGEKAAQASAAKGAALRIWGTAYLGYGTVHHEQMQAGAVMADGPYRHVRNPLYLGLWCVFAALGFLMPPSGALVTMALLTVFLSRLIIGEEAFLTAQLGQPYRNYLSAVPRLIPRLGTISPSMSAAAMAYCCPCFHRSTIG